MGRTRLSGIKERSRSSLFRPGASGETIVTGNFCFSEHVRGSPEVRPPLDPFTYFGTSNY